MWCVHEILRACKRECAWGGGGGGKIKRNTCIGEVYAKREIRHNKVMYL